MNSTERIKEFAESVSSFFLVFDGLFLYEDDAEQLLNDVKKSLEEKILHNETALPVIIAMGGNYDSDIDRAKVKQVDALLNLIKARKRLQEAESEAESVQANKERLLSALGLLGI